MKFILHLKNKFLQHKSTIPLGRWNIIYCENKINKKIDLSNEDHCGGCNQYDYDYKKDKEKDKKNKENNVNKFIFFETM